MILDSLREVHVIIDLKYIVVPHRLSNSFVMHKQEKTGHKKLNKKQSHKRGKSASKARRILTSKDVYYLVVKYEQENISKKAVENQEKLGNSSRGKIIMDNEEFELGKGILSVEKCRINTMKKFICVQFEIVVSFVGILTFWKYVYGLR